MDKLMEVNVTKLESDVDAKLHRFCRDHLCAQWNDTRRHISHIWPDHMWNSVGKQLKSRAKSRPCCCRKPRRRYRPAPTHTHPSGDEGGERRRASSGSTLRARQNKDTLWKSKPHFRMKMLLLLTWGRRNWKHWERSHAGPYTSSPSVTANHKRGHWRAHGLTWANQSHESMLAVLLFNATLKVEHLQGSKYKVNHHQVISCRGKPTDKMATGWFSTSQRPHDSLVRFSHKSRRRVAASWVPFPPTNMALGVPSEGVWIIYTVYFYDAKGFASPNPQKPPRATLTTKTFRFFTL